MEATRSERSEDFTRTVLAVRDVMTVPVFSVRRDDYVERAADLMQWKHIRHVPVTDEHVRVVGIVSYRTILHLVAIASDRPVAVFEVMHADPVSISPEASCLEALKLMRDHDVGCLPVVERGALVGIVTAADFIALSAELLDEWLPE